MSREKRITKKKLQEKKIERKEIKNTEKLNNRLHEKVGTWFVLVRNFSKTLFREKFKTSRETGPKKRHNRRTFLSQLLPKKKNTFDTTNNAIFLYGNFLKVHYSARRILCKKQKKNRSLDIEEYLNLDKNY